MAGHEGLTLLLIAWSHGDAAALDKLTPLVYDELRRLASRYLRQRPSQSLQPTALVHEAFVQMLGMTQLEWQSRAHFFGLAARIMRGILVDAARRKAAQKRGAGALTVTLNLAEDVSVGPPLNLVALDDALNDFGRSFPRQAKVVEMHFFGGLETVEIPAVLHSCGWDVSHRTVERDLQFARAWLRKELLA